MIAISNAGTYFSWLFLTIASLFSDFLSLFISHHEPIEVGHDRNKTGNSEKPCPPELTEPPTCASSVSPVPSNISCLINMPGQTDHSHYLCSLIDEIQLREELDESHTNIVCDKKKKPFALRAEAANYIPASSTYNASASSFPSCLKLATPSNNNSNQQQAHHDRHILLAVTEQIRGLIGMQKIHETIRLYTDLVNHPTVKPDTLLTNIFLTALIQHDMVETAEEIVLFPQNSMTLDIISMNIIAKGWCRRNDYAKCYRTLLVEGRQHRNIKLNMVSLNTLLDCAVKTAAHDNLQAALEIIVLMESLGLTPDKYTYSTLKKCSFLDNFVDATPNVQYYLKTIKNEGVLSILNGRNDVLLCQQQIPVVVNNMRQTCRGFNTIRKRPNINSSRSWRAAIDN